TCHGAVATSLPHMGLLSRLFGNQGGVRDLLADLTEDYRAEAAQAALLRAHAERARYPQAASALGALAETEERHAEWLRMRLLALGGQPPPAPRATAGRHHQWERAVAARHARRELAAAGGRSEHAARSPRIVRRSRHDYSDGLLASASFRRRATPSRAARAGARAPGSRRARGRGPRASAWDGGSPPR